MKDIQWQIISEPGKSVNEDIAFASKDMAWVIDSATGLTETKLTKEDSDGEWLVKEWDTYLREKLYDLDKTISEIVRNGIKEIELKFHKEVGKEFVNPIERPSASVAILRFCNDQIEYFLLGDCTLLYKDINDKVIKIKDDKLEKLDDLAISKMHNIRLKENLTFEEARKAINDTLIANRLLKNREEGYWTLEFDCEAINHCLSGKISASNLKSITIMSDGYSAIFDKYGYCTEEELMNLLYEKGVLDNYKIIRKIEEDDWEILKYPRFKKGDDSSVVFYSIC